MYIQKLFITRKVCSRSTTFFLYPFTFLMIICMSLDSFRNLVPLTLITLLKVKIQFSM